MKVVFAGTAEFAIPSLEALARAGHDIALVLTQPDRPRGRSGAPAPPPLKEAAARILPGVEVAQPEKLKGSDALGRILSEVRPAAVVVAAYGQMVPKALLAGPRFGCLNVHGSLLPRYRGAAPVQWAIARGEAETGVTIIRLTAKLDAGPVLARRALPIGERDTAPVVLERLATLGADLLVETLAGLEAGTVREEPQDEALATLAPSLTKEMGDVDWSLSPREIACRLRGFTPWPGAYSHLVRGAAPAPVRVAFAAAAPAQSTLPRRGEPGEVVGTSRDGLLVACGDDGVLAVERLKPEGKKEMTGAAWMNGRGVATGDRFVRGLGS